MVAEGEGDLAVPYVCEPDGTVRPLDGVESIFLTGSTIEICGLQHLVETEGDETALAFVAKEKLLGDVQFRGAISDFHPIKAQLQKADYDPLLVKYNHDDRYGDGNNFELAWKKSAADQWTQIADSIKERRMKEEKQAARLREETSLPRFKRTRIIKPWISQGSEREVEAEQLKAEIEKPLITARRKRKEFNRPINLSDKPASELWNANQASPLRPVHDSTQYAPQDLPETDKDDLFNSQAMVTFLHKMHKRCSRIISNLQFQVAVTRLEEVFLENQVVDVLHNDFPSPSEDGGTITERKETLLKEYQSFTDLVYSKSKVVTHIQWSPFKKGVLAVSYMDPSSFEMRSAACGKPQEFAILEWTICNPMTPQKVLLSTSEITTFQYNPSHPNILAAGSFTGQILLWDLERQENEEGTPDKKHACIFHHSYASSLDASDNSPIADVKWLQGVDMAKNGALTVPEADSNHCFVFVTCSIDGRLLFWDTRLEKTLKKVRLEARADLDVLDLQGQRLDHVSKLNMKPVYTVPLFGLDSEDSALQSLCFTPSNPKQLLAGTLNGDVILADLNKAEGADHPEITEDVLSAHSGPVTVLERSPFFTDVVMTVGGWTFKIWRDGKRAPLFASPHSLCKYTSGGWSPTKASALVLGTAAGVVEVWDLLDRTDQAALTASVCSIQITSIAFSPDFKAEKGDDKRHGQQFLAVGDHEGTTHLMLIPRALRKPIHNEIKLMTRLLHHQSLALEDITKRKDDRPKLIPKESAATEEQPIEVFITEKDEADYMELEKDMRERLGLIQD